MTNKLDIFKCNICGNIIEVVLSGGGELVCCSQKMELLTPKTADMSLEKHVPVLDENGEEKTVRTGSTPHPMTDEHYIQFIEVISKDHKWVKRKYLSPGEEPEMKFRCKCENKFSAIENCNIHGLWGNNFEGENQNGQ